MFRKKLNAIFSILIIFLLGSFINVELSTGNNTTTAGVYILNFLGRLHPLIVHFPIVLLILVSVFEWLNVKKKSTVFRHTIGILLPAGAITAIISCIFGYILSKEGEYGADLLDIHFWSGIATAIIAMICWMLHLLAFQKNNQKIVLSYLISIIFLPIAITVTGHYGATLTHGKDYLSSAFTSNISTETSKPLSFDLSKSKNDTVKLTSSQEVELNVKVRTILAHNCYKCHGPEKVKGDLRLDNINMIMKGGEHGPVVIPGNASESELYKRIILPAGHEDIMPAKGKRLSEEEIKIIAFWINKGAIWPGKGQTESTFRVASITPRNPDLPEAPENIVNPIDKWTNKYLTQKKISWPKQTDDRTFIRRVYLDIVGLLPTPNEIASFTSDKNPTKRDLLIKRLLNRNDDYATHWLSFWNDLLRNDYTGPGYITGGRFNITDWLYNSIKKNKPYTAFVKELISPSDESKGFIEGIKWRGVINASQRTEMQAAQNVAQVFLGLNLKCASCHNSFISDWKLKDAYAFANIFADSSLEINRCDKPTGQYTSPAMLWKNLGKIDSAASRKVKLEQLANIMVKPENGRLYRTLVNRIWKQMLGRGLVEPVDQMDNQPWNQDLLDWLSFDFQQNGSDIKRLIYLIASSRTYQTVSVGMKEPNDIFQQEYAFKGTLRKRLSAEQFADIAGAIIDPVYPDSIMKYKPSFDPGFTPTGGFYARAAFVANNPLLISMGRPTRENISTSRETQATLLQALELTNGHTFNTMLKRGANKWKMKYGNAEPIIENLYLMALGREPSIKEKETSKRMLGNIPSEESIQDLFWAVMLLPEMQIIF